MGTESKTIQKDQRSVAESAEYFAAPEATMSLPGSVAVGKKSKYVQKINISDQSEFTPEVAGAVSDFLNYSTNISSQAWSTVDRAVDNIFGFAEKGQQQAQSAYQSALDKEAGTMSPESKIVLYAVLAIVGILLFNKK